MAFASLKAALHSTDAFPKFRAFVEKTSNLDFLEIVSLPFVLRRLLWRALIRECFGLRFGVT